MSVSACYVCKTPLRADDGVDFRLVVRHRTQPYLRDVNQRLCSLTCAREALRAIAEQIPDGAGWRSEGGRS